MTIYKLCKMINLPRGAADQLRECENIRKDDIPADIKEKLFERNTWDKGLEELKTFLGEDPHSMKILWTHSVLSGALSRPQRTQTANTVITGLGGCNGRLRFRNSG